MAKKHAWAFLLILVGLMPLGIGRKQAVFAQTDSARVLNVGTRGSAKSSSIAISVCNDVAKFPGIPLLCSRNDLTDFKKTTLIELKKFIPKSWIRSWNKSECRIEFINDAILFYPELKDFSSIKSLNLGRAYIDEVNEISYETYSTLEGCLRWKSSEGWAPPYSIKMACNPEPFWGRELFRNGQRPDGSRMDAEERRSYELIYSYCADNPFLPPTFESELRKRWPENWVRKYLDLCWDFYEGAVWPEWMNVKIVQQDPKIQWSVSGITLDHGRVHPTVVLFWKYNPFIPMLYIQDEYWKVGGYPDDHAPRIWSKLMGRKPDIQIADSSIFADTGKDPLRPTIASEYDDLGFELEPCGGKKFEDAQITRAGMWMKNGWIVVNSKCVHTIKECSSWVYDPKTNKPVDKENDCCDCMKYTVEAIERKKPPRFQPLTVEYFKRIENPTPPRQYQYGRKSLLAGTDKPKVSDWWGA